MSISNIAQKWGKTFWDGETRAGALRTLFLSFILYITLFAISCEGKTTIRDGETRASLWTLAGFPLPLGFLPSRSPFSFNLSPSTLAMQM